MRSPRARPHGGREPSARKYGDDDDYSAHESDRRTPYSEYEKSRTTHGKRTVFSEYTTDADYTDEDRSSYSESDNGKRTPYSEYVTEYTDETDDDRMSGTLGIARNQYCTTLNALVEGSDSSSSGSSYSQSTFASDFDRMCNANVNTNCMATLFNRNTDLPGTIHCGGENSVGHQKMSIPLPLHYMDHLVPSKQEFNSVLDNLAQKFDTGDEERPGFPQVYKSLFEANLSQTASDEDEERLAEYAPRRKGTERNRSQELGFTKSKRDGLQKIEKDKDSGMLIPPSHIIIKDDFTAVSSAESFGFAPETQKIPTRENHKKERREGNNRQSSPRHTVSHRPSPRHKTPHGPSPRHSSPGRPSPRHSSPRRIAEKKMHEHDNTKLDTPTTTRHGLDRLMRKEATTVVSKRRDEEETPEFKGEAGMKSPLFVGRAPNNGKSKSFPFRHMDESRQDANASEIRISNSRREGATYRLNTAAQSKSREQPNRQVSTDPVEKESPRIEERFAPIKASIANAKASRTESQLTKNFNAHASGNKNSLIKEEHNGVSTTIDASALQWRNSASTIPHILTLKLTQTGVSELSGEPNAFGDARIDSTPLKTIVASSQGNGGVNVQMSSQGNGGVDVQMLSLKPTQTAVSELTGEAGDFGESRGLSVPLGTIVASPRAMEIPPTQIQSCEERKPKRSPLVISEMRVQTTPSRKNKGLINDMAEMKSTNGNPKEPVETESSLNGGYVVARRSKPNKKAETLDELEDALMGSRESASSEYLKAERQGFSNTRVFAFDESKSSPMEDPGNENSRTTEKPPKKTIVKAEDTKKPSNDIKLKSTQQESGSATSTRQSEPFEVMKVTLNSTGKKKREEKLDESRAKDKHDEQTKTIRGEGVNTALSLYPSSFSAYCNDISGNNGESSKDHDDVHGDGLQKTPEDDRTSLSALDNEISLLESQITGLEQQDQVPEFYSDQITAGSPHLEPSLLESEESLTPIIGETKMNDVDSRFESSGEPSKPSPIPPESSGDFLPFKPPLVPTEHGSMSKSRKKSNNNSSSKSLSKPNKSTDVTLVTAPTVMTMDTPFTVEDPLVLSPAVKREEERKNTNSNLLVTTAIALPFETGFNDGDEINAPFFFVFIVGTRKYFFDVLIIIVAWLRHLSSPGIVQRQQRRFRLGLMVPPIAEDDVLREHQLQSKSFVVSRLPSPASEEPGIIVESFVPEMWAERESAGGKNGALLPPLGTNSIWSRLFRKKEVGK